MFNILFPLQTLLLEFMVERGPCSRPGLLVGFWRGEREIVRLGRRRGSVVVKLGGWVWGEGVVKLENI